MIVFDMDGTLVQPPIIDTWIAAAARHGLTLNREQLAAAMGGSFDAWRKLGITDEMRVTRREIARTMPVPRVEPWATIYEHNPYCIATAASEATMRMNLELAGLPMPREMACELPKTVDASWAIWDAVYIDDSPRVCELLEAAGRVVVRV